MPDRRSFRTLLNQERDNLALVIGNGINIHGAGNRNSWERLLVQIAHHCAVDVPSVPKGTALTEFYDVLEMKRSNPTAADDDQAATLNLQAEFCRLMERWEPLRHHHTIMNWAVRHDVPVLTTNFEEVLSDAAGCDFIKPPELPFTDFYPWSCRFANRLFDDPCNGFGIWHINGMRRYRRSIRLGLSHYMGSVQRARTWLHRGEANLFNAKNRPDWDGARTWVHIMFNKPLLIFGLGLTETEVFLRWLLIERARYFRKFPERAHPAWYVYTHKVDDTSEAGKLFFLEGVGINCVKADYAEIYESPSWEA